MRTCPPARRALAGVVIALLSASPADAATVNVPINLAFHVQDPSQATPGNPILFIVSFSGASPKANQRVRISVRAKGLSFTPSYPGLDASDASWTIFSATNGSGVAGSLSTTYRQVFTGQLGGTSGSVTLMWSLAPLPAGTPPGVYTLQLQWAFEVV